MFLDIHGNRLQVVSFGSGATTLLAHGGWVGNWELWQQPFELLSTRWRCVSYDHRGSGESVVAPEAITPAALVDDLFAVMDALGIERCILAGESLGGLVTLQAAARAPERFTGLVLVDGAPAVTRATVQPLIAGSRANYEATLAAFVDACTPEPEVEHIRRWGRDILRRATPAAAARIFECYLDPGEPPVALDRIRVPTLVLHGTKDAVVPPAVGAMMAKTIPDARLVELPGAGHVPTMTRPREVVDAIVAWATERGLT